YAETREQVHRFAAGLLALGIQKGDRISVISEGRNLWVFAELGILYAGAINVPISVKINEHAELKFRLAHSGCRMAVVSGNQAQKVEAIKKDLPDLETIVLLDGKARDSDEVEVGRLLALGDEWLADHGDRFEAIYRAVGEDDPATISYTSGTTADPKGIILTHRNYTANVEQGAAMVTEIQPYWRSLIILPWDHAFGHTVGIYIMMFYGAKLASVQAGQSPRDYLRNVPKNIQEVRPHFMLSVPALAANFRKNVERGIKQKGPRAEKLFQRALRNAYSYIGDGWNKGHGLRALRAPLHRVFDRLIFSKVREGFGGRLEFFISGAAMLDIEMQRFFHAIGIPMYQGYGLSEAAPIISSNTPSAHKFGSSGRIVPDLEVRICTEAGDDLPVGEKGEIVVKGENVMAGYWRNPGATAKTLKNGWLFTGDLGYLDSDGYLFVLGRVKSLLINGTGEKYSPEGIEEALVSGTPYIDQVMLHNDHDPYTVALIVPNRENLIDWLGQQGLDCDSNEGQEAVIELFQAEIDSFRDGGARDGLFEKEWLPAAFAILGAGFTEENHLLNSSLKLVRRKVRDFYRDRLDYLYTPEGKDPLNQRNRRIVSRLDE
ncbi:MAG: AMP-binding protein, partial [Gemmatimonadetes bacterium]|nr:AMP-binding protein [Gemmatimonadota bacterium]